MSGTPQDDAARARALLLLRIARLETSWAALRRGESAPPLISSMHRDLEMLRASTGEEIGGVCDGITRALTFAKSRAYQVPEKLADVVTTGIRLSAAVVRNGGSSRALEGFQRQVQEAVRHAGASGPEAGGDASLQLVEALDAGVQAGALWRGELAVAATTAFVAHLRADGGPRARLHAAWQALAAEASSGGTPGVSTVGVLRFRAPSWPVDLAVPADWTIDPVDGPDASATPPVDLLSLCSGAPAPDFGGREPPLVLALKREGLRIAVAAATLATAAVARPLCPTPDAHPMEVVSVDGAEVLLLRPERLSPRSG
jgi:hypothetical protein